MTACDPDHRLYTTTMGHFQKNQTNNYRSAADGAKANHYSDWLKS